MLHFASFNYPTSLREGREREKDCYLSRQVDCSRKTWAADEAASWQQIRFSDAITLDSLRGMFVTNKTGKSYYALLWVIHSCYILCTNSDVCWTALWADSLHLPGKKSHTANLGSSNPISTGAPTVTDLLSKEHKEDSVVQILLNIY